MDAYLLEALQMIFRFFHVIAAMAWIGASFYFVWLDNHLQTPPEWKKAKGIRGDLWAIHGGGFYEVAKYQNGPETMPKTLHWFKWEAYTTWLTGFLLFTLVYYVGAEAFLVDSGKMALDKGSAIAFSLALLLAGWLIYEGLNRLPVKGLWFAALCLAALTLYFVILNQLFAQKAAFLQTGALIGTCMAANVFFHIMPAQRYMVDEIAAGRLPDPAPGMRAKTRSVHNNYATLPVLFLMMSGHFAFVTGQSNATPVIAVLVAAGMWIRHYFNLKHQGQHRPSVLISGLGCVVALLVFLAPWDVTPEVVTTQMTESQKVVSAEKKSPGDAQGMSLIEKHCQGCHSRKPQSTLFASAPMGLTLDSANEVLAHKAAIVQRTLVNKDMPLGNMTQMTTEEREALKVWLAGLGQ